MFHTTGDSAQGFGWSQITLNYERWSCTSLLSSPIFSQPLTFSDIILVAWNQPWQEYLYHEIWQMYKSRPIYLSIHSLPYLSTHLFIGKPVVKLLPAHHWCRCNYAGSCIGAGNFSDLYFIILLYFQLLDDMIYNRNSGSNGKVHFPCLFCFQRVTLSGKMMFRIQF